MTTAVVTGSASGIGAAVTACFVDRGVRVVGIDRADADVVADLSTVEGREAAVSGALDRTGGVVDRVVACAGVGPHVQPHALIASVNYFGAVEVLDGLLGALGAADDACALAICSNSAGITPVPEPKLVDAFLDGDEATARSLADDLDGAVVYGNSKLALSRAVRRRVEDWGKAGVRIVGIAPGPVETPMLAGTLDHPDYGPATEGLPIPIGRRGRPEEIAGIIEWLTGPDAALVHGSIVVADGGSDALLRPDDV